MFNIKYKYFSIKNIYIKDECKIKDIEDKHKIQVYFSNIFVRFPFVLFFFKFSEDFKSKKCFLFNGTNSLRLEGFHLKWPSYTIKLILI